MQLESYSISSVSIGAGDGGLPSRYFVNIHSMVDFGGGNPLGHELTVSFDYDENLTFAQISARAAEEAMNLYSFMATQTPTALIEAIKVDR